MAKKILITGKNIDPKYNRTLILIKGLRKLGYQVDIYNYPKASKESAFKINELSRECLFVFLPSFSHKSVGFVKKHSSCPVVFDPLISKYMTYVLDYRKYSKWSYGALRTFFRDRSALRKSDFTIFDTREQQSYFIERYKLAENKTGVVYIGANNDDFFPVEETDQSGPFIAGFVGAFIPLQGVMKIMQAAHLLRKEKDIRFELVGTGYDYEEAVRFAETKQLKNVTFLQNVAYEDVNQHINRYHVCLGIFGDSVKTGVVIPNKIFNYASCGKAIITVDTPAIRECFCDQQNIFLVDGSPAGIAAAILTLRSNNELRVKLGSESHTLAIKTYNEEETARAMIDQYIKYRQKL